MITTLYILLYVNLNTQIDSNVIKFYINVIFFDQTTFGYGRMQPQDAQFVLNITE